MSLPAHSEYKPAAHDWLGSIPVHWRMDPLKRHTRIVTGATPSSSNQAFWDGGIAWATPIDLTASLGSLLTSTARTISEVGLESCATELVPAGSVLLSTRAPIGTVAVAGIVTSINQGCRALVPGDSVNSRFIAYILGVWSDHLGSLGRGSTFLELSTDSLGAVKLPIPRLPEQATIVAFLDRETTKIDALIAEQERLIALLQEKRQVVISHAVTKGLDSRAPMKDSGVAHFGQIPASWSLSAVRSVVHRIEQGWSPQCHSHPAADEEWGVLKAGCVNGGRYDDAQNKALPAHLEAPQHLEVQAGDLLMSRASGSPKLIGSVARVGVTRSKLILSDKIYRIHCSPELSADWFSLAFASRPLRHQIEMAISGAEGLANNLSQSSLLSFLLCVPPSEEQKRILDATNHALLELAELQTQASQAITLLRERRNALITAAVTGQIDVRGLVENAF